MEPETTATPEPATQQTSPGTRARWTNLAATGLFLAALGPLLMFLAGLVFGLDLGDFGKVLLLPAIVGMGTSFLVLKAGTWAKIVGIVVALLIGMMLFWTFFSIFVPASFFDFVPGLLVMPGVILALIGCIAGLVAKKRGHLGTAPTGGERSTIRVALGVIALLAIVSAILTVTSQSEVPATTQAAATVTAEGFEWDEESYTVPSGSSIVVRNDQPFFHTATIDALDIDEALTPGSEAVIRISQPGTYILYCRPHTRNPENPGDDDMAATLVVT